MLIGVFFNSVGVKFIYFLTLPLLLVLIVGIIVLRKKIIHMKTKKKYKKDSNLGLKTFVVFILSFIASSLYINILREYLINSFPEEDILITAAVAAIALGITIFLSYIYYRKFHKTHDYESIDTEETFRIQ
jgi:ABC-type Mn2+/Zn2+ transport system permease subunit